MMLEELLTGRNISLAGGVFVVMAIGKNYIAPKFWTGKIGQRLLPVIPLALGIGGAFLGFCDCTTWQDKLAIGLIAGWASSHTFKLGKTSVLGWGIGDADGDGVPDAPPAPAPAPVAAPVPAPAPAPEAAPAAPAAADKKE